MPKDFAPEKDLDAFQDKLQGALEKDDETQPIMIIGIVAVVLVVAAIAIIVVYNVLKNYVGSYQPVVPDFINPCKRGAFVNVADTMCVFVPCAVTDDQGNLAPGFYDTQEECQAQFTPVMYLAQATAPSGVQYSFCTTQKPPDGWTGQSFQGATNDATLIQCQSAAEVANANLGVFCDPNTGPALCDASPGAPAPDGLTCQPATRSVKQNPNDLRTMPCTLFSGCDRSQGTPGCAQKYALSIDDISPPLTNVMSGSCASRQGDPCNISCPAQFLFDKTKQTAALRGSDFVYQQGSTDPVRPASAPGATGQPCSNAFDCCAQLKDALGLTYELYPDVSDNCPTGGFACVPDFTVNNPGQCQACNDNCFRVQRMAGTPGGGGTTPYWYCGKYDASMGTNNVAFTSLAKCQSVVQGLNTDLVGFYCSSNSGTKTCAPGSTGCVTATADQAASPDKYVGTFPSINAFDPPCVRRTSDCTGAPGNCVFSREADKVLCSSCPNPACDAADESSRWTCTATANGGAQCVKDSQSTFTLDDACAQLGDQVTRCGCGCVLPGQACVDGTVVGRACDPAINGLPLTYQCGAGSKMQSASSWDPTQKTCVPSVPVFDQSKQPVLYFPPVAGTNNACLVQPSDLTGTTQAVGALWFLDDPSLSAKTWFPCPYSVYQACQGDTPIAPKPADGSDMYCSYDSFSGTNPLGGISVSQAMCVMNLVNVNDASNKDVPVCLSYTINGNETNVLLTGCLDAGAPGSVNQPATLKDLVATNSYCGQCNQAGPGVNVCPMAPQGFTTAGGCKTLADWNADDSLDPNVKSYITNKIAGLQTYNVLVPSVYAGVQGTSDTPFNVAAKCKQPPGRQADGTLGYCNSADGGAVGQCKGAEGILPC